ncbi:hypothetical protein [Nonomuraea roseoviolacea]|uniref:Uncharacterized protein n=1 Tax=Nonomuraea roseoviolacea subsp. carminata TaxID=160689 RepID=A0ABT1JS17_9ACTN|nr:hypothetical protein [Nonomuraea roseoviolacea]MCP2344538.1 hypothetical protein [Nonomuraea roseoviolacea subsp. carminata]
MTVTLNTGQPSTSGADTQTEPTRAVFVVITVQTAYGEVSTSSHDLIVPVGMRHLDLLTRVLKERIPEHLRGNCVVLHYSVHPAVIS